MDQSYLDPILDAPDGDQVAAIFDMDGTLLSGFTAYVFAQDRFRQRNVRDLGILREALEFRFGQATFRSLLLASAGTLEGTPVDEAEEHARRIFRRHIASMIYPEARAMIAAHHKKGHRLIMISAATQYQVEAVADDLGFDEVICNRLIAKDGVITGEVEEPIIYGNGKAEVALELAEEHGFDLAESFAYSDGHEDLPLLEAVGHPRPLNPDAELIKDSAQRGWETLEFDSRGRPPLNHILRTIASNAAMVPAVTAGLLTGATNGSRRQAVNLAMSTWGDFAVALAGVNLDVLGEAHLWSHRPCVFMFNHQSNFDSLILMKLLRRDITAVAKKELAMVPLIGPLFAFGNVVFIDRGDHERAVEAIHHAVETLHSGLSIAIAPEGTRQPTPTLGPFKKGGFHLAREAGVPIVPIVIHNSHDVLPRGARVIRPTTVEVTVLPPVATEHWAADELDDHVEELRSMFLEALGQEAAY